MRGHGGGVGGEGAWEEGWEVKGHGGGVGGEGAWEEGWEVRGYGRRSRKENHGGNVK